MAFFRSNLFFKTFSMIVVGVVLLTGSYYLLSVPMIGKMTFELEERSHRAFLDDMFELIRQAHADLVVWKNSIYDAHKRELRDIVKVSENYIRSVQRDIEAGRMTRGAGQKEILDRLRNFKYGANDYVFVTDYANRLISHPDPNFNGKDFSEVRDVRKNLVIPPMVDGARKHGEFYYSYWWTRLGEESSVEKLTYCRDLPEWGWVVCTGIYVDDIAAEVSRRRTELVEQLRRHLRERQVGEAGYMYVFDSDMRIVIHPTIEPGTDVSSLLNPGNGRKLFTEELVEASKRPDHKLAYNWDTPADPGNYDYSKISWVRYFDGFDWYIAASVYQEDLERSAQALTRRILLVSLFGLFFAIGGAYLFVTAFTTPIKRLADSANRISAGDLSITPNIRRDDEIGVLALAFNSMVEQLKDQIRNLEDRVGERTRELASRAKELEQRNVEMHALSSMSDLLHACKNVGEIYEVVAKTLNELFPGSSGCVMQYESVSQLLEATASWGGASQNPAINAEGCWGLRRGKTHLVEFPEKALSCAHDASGRPYVCVPLFANNQTLGVIRICFDTAGAMSPASVRLAETTSEHAALALSNLMLRQSLLTQSIKDPLTGLYNRRFLNETMAREEQRTLRQGASLGVIMLDVDHFKRVNDSMGHDAGDHVLRELANMLLAHVRKEDIVCRYGGEEFTVLMPNANIEQCLEKAEALRNAAMEDLSLFFDGQPLQVTISLGCAAFPRHGTSIKKVLEEADAALYKAKRGGRNRVVASGTAAKEEALAEKE